MSFPVRVEIWRMASPSDVKIDLGPADPAMQHKLSSNKYGKYHTGLLWLRDHCISFMCAVMN